MNLWQYLHWQFSDSIVPVIQFFSPKPGEVLELIPYWCWVPIILTMTAYLFILWWMIGEWALLTDMWE